MNHPETGGAPRAASIPAGQSPSDADAIASFAVREGAWWGEINVAAAQAVEQIETRLSRHSLELIQPDVLRNLLSSALILAEVQELAQGSTQEVE